MNHFRVKPDSGADFERVWRERRSYLEEVPGFESFHLLRGPVEEGAQLYASHTVWTDQAAFSAWTESDAFRKATPYNEAFYQSMFMVKDFWAVPEYAELLTAAARKGGAR